MQQHGTKERQGEVERPRQSSQYTSGRQENLSSTVQLTGRQRRTNRRASHHTTGVFNHGAHTNTTVHSTIDTTGSGTQERRHYQHVNPLQDRLHNGSDTACRAETPERTERLSRRILRRKNLHMLLVGERPLQKPQSNHRSNCHRNSPCIHQIHELAREQNHQTHSRKTQSRKQNILQNRKSHHTVQATQSTEEHRHQRRNQNESRTDAHSRLIFRSHRHNLGVDVHTRHQKHRSHQRRNQTVLNQLRQHAVTTQRTLSAHRTN